MLSIFSGEYTTTWIDIRATQLMLGAIVVLIIEFPKMTPSPVFSSLFGATEGLKS